MSKSPLRHRARRGEKSKEQRRLWMDAHGVYFHEVRNWLPGRVSDWPKVRFVVNPVLLQRYAGYRGGVVACQMPRCSKPGCDPHHIIGGSGKSDELTNLLWVCRGCHEEIQGDPSRLADVLRAKWKAERELVSWVRLVQLHGRWFDFDDLED